VRIALLLAVAILVNAATARNADAVIVYDVDRTIQTMTVVGTITTDGTIGTLATSNILAWSLTLDDTIGGTRLIPAVRPDL